MASLSNCSNPTRKSEKSFFAKIFKILSICTLVNKRYHNWEVLIDMFYYGFDCVKWVDMRQLTFLIDDKASFENAWQRLTRSEMSYENIARGLR